MRLLFAVYPHDGALGSPICELRIVSVLRLVALSGACVKSPRAIRFWSAALNYRPREGTVRGLRQMSIKRVSSDAETHHVTTLTAMPPTSQPKSGRLAIPKKDADYVGLSPCIPTQLGHNQSVHPRDSTASPALASATHTSARAASLVHLEMNEGLSYLAATATAAPLIGLPRDNLGNPDCLHRLRWRKVDVHRRDHRTGQRITVADRSGPRDRLVFALRLSILRHQARRRRRGDGRCHP